MGHARIQQRKEPLDFVKAKIIHCFVLVQLKKTHPDTTEQEGPIAHQNPGTYGDILAND